MAGTRVGAETVGKVFVDERGHVWKQIAWLDRPSATFERLHHGSELAVNVVGIPIDERVTSPSDSSWVENLTLLVPEATT